MELEKLKDLKIKVCHGLSGLIVEMEIQPEKVEHMNVKSYLITRRYLTLGEYKELFPTMCERENGFYED